VSDRVGLLFSGQGSQRAGMGDPWQHTDAWALTARISDLSGHDVDDLLLRADDETLRRTDRAQMSTFALEMVALEALRIRGDLDGTVAAAGHSLGEYSALVAAGILSLDDATRLVAARGAAMLEAASANRGTMVAVLGASDDALAETVEKLRADGARVWIANLNAPGQTVLAGDEAGIAAAADAFAALPRTKIRALPVGGAFHSPLMAPAADALRDALDATGFRPGAVPVVANVDAEAHTGGPEWRDLLHRQLTSPVRWTESVRTLVDGPGCSRFVEIGPGDTLTAMVKRIARDVPCGPAAAG
jgi:[acyl-carrier-protein] S-malonyltransferase